MKSYKPEFARTFIYNLLLIIIIIVAIMDFIWIYQTYADLETEVKELRSDYLEEQKILIRNEVQRISNYIDYREKNLIREKEVDVTSKLNNLYHKIYVYYKQNSNFPKETLKANILELINSEKLDKKKYYTLIYSYNSGILKKELSLNKNYKNGSILNESIVRNLINNYKNFDLNSNDYLWQMKGANASDNEDNNFKTDYLKLGVIKYLKPLNLFIILGTYSSDLSKTVQGDVLGWVDKLKFPSNQYFFIDKFDGTPLVFDGKKVDATYQSNVNQKIVDNYKGAVKKVITTGGRGYLYYPVSSRISSKIFHKISYIQAISDWNWIIGAGVYMENIENEINIMRQKLEIKTIYNITGFILLLISFIIISLLIARIIINKAQKSFNSFHDFFDKAASSSMIIEPEKQTFKEFEVLANSANSMIKKRIKIEEALRFSENRFKDIAENLADWIWEINSNLKYNYVSGKVENILGKKPEELIGKFYYDEYLSSSDDATKQNFMKLINEGEKIIDFNVWLNDYNGNRICLQTNALPFFDDDKFCGYRGVSKDITEKINAIKELRKHHENLEFLINKRTEELAEKQAQLIHSGRLAALGEMAAGMAHEINQPLSTIKFILNNLKMAIKEGKFDQIYFNNKSEKMHNSIERIANIINHVRVFSRAQSNTGDKFEIFFVKQSISNTLQLTNQQLKNNYIEVSVAVDNTLKIKGDPYKLEQVLINLISNAKDAVLDKKKQNPDHLMKIDIKAFKNNNEINIIVKDNGIGIPEKNIDKIINPFFTTKEAGKGTGLGLSISYGILQEMNGNIIFKSNLDETLAIITLPLIV